MIELTTCTLTPIEESRCNLVILSEHYAQFRWCLDGLAKIIECKNQNGKLVFLIFYHVEPSYVRKQMESYGEAFSSHKDHEEGRRKVERWGAALTEVANLSEWHVQNG